VLRIRFTSFFVVGNYNWRRLEKMENTRLKFATHKHRTGNAELINAGQKMQRWKKRKSRTAVFVTFLVSVSRQRNVSVFERKSRLLTYYRDKT